MSFKALLGNGVFLRHLSGSSEVVEACLGAGFPPENLCLKKSICYPRNSQKLKMDITYVLNLALKAKQTKKPRLNRFEHL